jgi:hypothetical protein
VHHCTIQINHQPDATIFQFIIPIFIYSLTCFGRSPAHHQELNDRSSSLWFYLHIVVIAVLCSWSGQSAQPRTQHGYHHDTKVKPEAATAVIELLIMGVMGERIPETCRAVNKCQDNKLVNYCIWLWFIWIQLIKLFYLCCHQVLLQGLRTENCKIYKNWIYTNVTEMILLYKNSIDILCNTTLDTSLSQSEFLLPSHLQTCSRQNKCNYQHPRNSHLWTKNKQQC